MVPAKYNIRKRKQTVSVFKGINRGINTTMSRMSSKNSALFMEFKDMKNMSLDDYPAIRTRNKRQFYGKKNVMYIRSIISNILATKEGIVYLENSGRLYFGNSFTELFRPETVDDKNRSVIRTLYEFSNKVVVMPDKLIVTMQRLGDRVEFVKEHIEKIFTGKKGVKTYIRKTSLNTSVEITDHYIEKIDIDLNNKDAQKNSTEHGYKEFFTKLKLGDLIENTATFPSSLYLVTEIKEGEEYSDYIDSRQIIFTQLWSTYTKIERKEIGVGFRVDDWVRISEITDINTLNSSYKILECSDDYIVINCEINKSQEYTGAINIERKMPADMDFMVSINNRMWGCSSVNNRIYASKLGDITNWEAYGDDISTDSYWVDVSTEGDFTGVTVSSSAIYFFKENCIHKIIGTKPRNFTVTVYKDLGVKSGSENSIVWIKDRIIYHSPVGVCVYSPGGEPTLISENALTRNLYSSAVAGKHRDKYYISLLNDETNEYELYVYDLNSGQWLKEDDLRFTSTATYNNQMYFANENTGYIGCIETQKDNLLRKNFESYVIPDVNNAIGEFIEGTDLTLGDINGDEMVTLEDVIMFQTLLSDPVELEKLTQEERDRIEKVGDTKFDGSITVQDVTAIQKWVEIPELFYEDKVNFMLVSGDLYDYYSEKNYIQKVELIAELFENSVVTIFISCDGKPFEEMKTVYADRKKKINLPLRPERCDSFRIKIEGSGEFILYGLALTTKAGGR